MDKRFSEEAKSKLTKELAADLPLMRAKLGLSQEELGAKIGITRQTIVAFETGKRPISWSVYLSLMFLFFRNESTKKLVWVLGLYTKELDEFLTLTEKTSVF